jgi:hypothetical protein
MQAQNRGNLCQDGIIHGTAFGCCDSFGAHTGLRGQFSLAEAEAAHGFTDDIIEKIFEGEGHGGRYNAGRHAWQTKMPDGFPHPAS